MLNLASLNQRVNALSAKINAIVPDNLTQVLTAGDSANAPLKLVITDSALGKSTTLFGSTIDVELDNGITTDLTGYGTSSIAHNGDSNFAVSTDKNLTITADNLNMTTTGMSLINSSVGYTSNPSLVIDNTNATVGNTNGVPSIEFNKTGRNGATNDITGSIVFNAKDAAGVKRTFGKIENTITTNIAPANYDGSLDFYTLINGVNQNVFRMNGQDNENNTLRPFDLNGNALKTSLTNLNIEATSSTGTGQIILTPKPLSNVNINGDLLMTTDKTITLNDNSPSFVQTVLGSGALLVNDVSNSLSSTLNQSGLSFQNSTPTTTTYSLNGFANNDNSIQCNSSNGFYMNYGSVTNFTQLDLDSFEMYNTNGTTIDQITMGNNGTGNPVFNILSTDNTSPSPLIKQCGISNQQLNLFYNDVGVGGTTQLTLTNNTSGSGQLNYTNGIDPSQTLTISSNCTIELQTSQDLKFTGAQLQSSSSSGNSGEHLRILLNGTYYKIKLEND